MDENPTPLRLKELETLEKVTEKIDKLTVFGGPDGVLKDVVRIQVPSCGRYWPGRNGAAGPQEALNRRAAKRASSIERAAEGYSSRAGD